MLPHAWPRAPRSGVTRQGVEADLASVIRAQSTWDYPQGSRLFAHATDTDDAVTPPTAVSDCLSARAAKNRQQFKLGKGAQE